MVLRVIHVAPLFDVRDTSGVSLILCRYSSGEKKQTATVGRNVCLRTHAIPERLRGVFTTRRYTNTRLPLPLFFDCDDALVMLEQVMLSEMMCLQEIARHVRPRSLRALFGRTKAQNSVHCTDLPEDGQLEVEYFFKILDQ